MDIKRRHFLRKRDSKQLVEELRTVIGNEAEKLFKENIEVVKTDLGELYAENKVVLAFRIDGRLLPSLRALNNGLVHLPTVTVDMGAVPYVTNGADIMAPGITDISIGLKAGQIVAIVDERYGKSLAVGELLFDREEILQMKKGKAVRNLHYVNDEIWKVKL